MNISSDIYGIYANKMIIVNKFGIKYYQRFKENEGEFYKRAQEDFLKNFKFKLKIDKIES